MDQSVQVSLSTKERKQYSGIPLRIMKLLGTGCLDVEAARACGVDPSYVSQLKNEKDFVEQVNEIVAKTFAQQSEIDNNYVEVEKVLSERLLKNAGMIFSTDQMLRVLKFANEAKKKVAPILGNGNGSNGTEGPGMLKPVVLILPIAVTKEFIVNPQNEIVGISGQVLETLPSTQLPNLVAKHHKERAAQSQADKELKQGFKILKNGPGQIDPYGDL